MISVIVATCNRPEKIGYCLKSVLNNFFSDFEVIIVDQSDSQKSKHEILSLSSPKIRYFKLDSQGKSKALNFALAKVRGDLIAFTDDDCLVDKYWLKNINNFFQENKDITGLFGKVLSFKPDEHRNQICLATFPVYKRKIINNPDIIHYKDLGIGNNMSLRASIFSQIGNFREWLGPGLLDIGGGEESELIYRILKKGYKLASDPKIIVYHNHWLSYSQEQFHQGKYTSAAMRFYFYYLLKKEKLMIKFIRVRLEERIGNKIKILLRMLKRFDLKNIFRNKKEFIYISWELFCVFKGFSTGIFYSLKER
jgi:O-antigen biosynthesis protein